MQGFSQSDGFVLYQKMIKWEILPLGETKLLKEC